VAIGWLPDLDLSAVRSRDELYPLYKRAHPEDKSNLVVGQQVGQIARFLLEMQAGDWVITPAADTEWLHIGQVGTDPSYFHFQGDDGCPYRQRRRVTWQKERRKRADFSVPFQNTIRSSLTIFEVGQREEFLALIGHPDSSVRTDVGRRRRIEPTRRQLLRPFAPELAMA
jgi:restriction system protein